MVLVTLKKFIIPAMALLLSGCFYYCKGRRFVTDEPWTPVTDNWELGFSMFNWEPCKGGEDFDCNAVFHIESKFLDKDSLKNISIRIDSLYLQIEENVYKRINEKGEFSHAVPRNKNNPPDQQKYVKIMSIVDRDSLKADDPWPLKIPKKVKTATVTVYVSFKYPDDGHIESKVIKKELHESYEKVFVEGPLMH